MKVKLLEDKTIITGKIYTVVRHHYMGMDGDYYETICAYTDEDMANRKADKLDRDCDHIDSPYDTVTYRVEEIDLIA